MYFLMNVKKKKGRWGVGVVKERWESESKLGYYIICVVIGEIG